MSDHWHRDEPTFYNFFNLDATALDAPAPIDGLDGVLMSEDRQSEARTYYVTLPRGFKANVDAKDGSLEFFVLSGELLLDGERAGSQCYIHLPQGGEGGELSSPNGGQAIVFFNPHLPAFPYPLTRNRVILTHEKEWTPSIPGAHGVMHKSLRLPDPVPHPIDEGFDGGPGGYIRFQYIAPNTIAEDEHVHHECWEEIILLQGDVLLLNEGQMGVGSVVSHPQEWYHAPFASRRGALILVHTDAPMGFPWPPRAYPMGREICERYLETAELPDRTDHVDWDVHPLKSMQEESAEYQQWRTDGEGQHYWGGYETTTRCPERPGGRGTASAYRASWKRTV